MRSIIKSRPRLTHATNLATVKSGTREQNRFYVMEWPRNKDVPRELSDWLAFLLMFGILDEVDRLLNDSEICSVRYNLGAFLNDRFQADQDPKHKPLFPYYPQIITIQKVGVPGNGNFNVWVDGHLTSMIRNGFARGRKIYSKAYNRKSYNVSRLLATSNDDVLQTAMRFPHAPRQYFWFSGLISSN